MKIRETPIFRHIPASRPHILVSPGKRKGTDNGHYAYSEPIQRYSEKNRRRNLHRGGRSGADGKIHLYQAVYGSAGAPVYDFYFRHVEKLLLFEWFPFHLDRFPDPGIVSG